MKQRVSWCVWGLSAALVGCRASSAEDGLSPTAIADESPAAQSLCPDCVAGGETTDFTGDVICEVSAVAPLEQGSPLAAEFGVDGVLSALAQPLSASMGWRRAPGGSVAAGYERETQVEIAVDVLGLEHAELVNLNDGSPCGDFVQLDARMHLQTADGALRGSFERPLRILRGSNAAYLSAISVEDSPRELDLRDFTGTLDLGLDRERPHGGSVGVEFAAGPAGLAGSLYITVVYLEPGGRVSSRFHPLQAQWPSNGCEREYVPVDPDMAIAADGATARDYWQRHRDRLAEVYPAAATWLDGGTTELGLELEQLTGACQNRTRPSDYYVQAPLQIQTSDGRFSTTQLARASFRTDEDALGSVVVEGEATARAAFMEQVTAPGMDWASDFEASFELYSRSPSEGAPSGDLQIVGFDGEGHNRLYLHWCSGSDCGTFPRPRDRL